MSRGDQQKGRHVQHGWLGIVVETSERTFGGRRDEWVRTSVGITVNEAKV